MRRAVYQKETLNVEHGPAHAEPQAGEENEAGGLCEKPAGHRRGRRR